jgi:hypothetical protein
MLWIAAVNAVELPGAGVGDRGPRVWEPGSLDRITKFVSWPASHGSRLMFLGGSPNWPGQPCHPAPRSSCLEPLNCCPSTGGVVWKAQNEQIQAKPTTLKPGTWNARSSPFSSPRAHPPSEPLDAVKQPKTTPLGPHLQPSTRPLLLANSHLWRLSFPKTLQTWRRQVGVIGKQRSVVDDPIRQGPHDSRENCNPDPLELARGRGRDPRYVPLKGFTDTMTESRNQGLGPSRTRGMRYGRPYLRTLGGADVLLSATRRHNQ